MLGENRNLGTRQDIEGQTKTSPIEWAKTQLPNLLFNFLNISQLQKQPHPRIAEAKNNLIACFEEFEEFIDATDTVESRTERLKVNYKNNESRISLEVNIHTRNPEIVEFDQIDLAHILCVSMKIGKLLERDLQKLANKLPSDFESSSLDNLDLRVAKFTTSIIELKKQIRTMLGKISNITNIDDKKNMMDMVNCVVVMRFDTLFEAFQKDLESIKSDIKSESETLRRNK